MKHKSYKRRRRYLYGLSDDYISIRDIDIKKPSVRKRLERQRKIYGFDERETWNLDYHILELLYERLRMYKDTASDIIDMTYRTYEYKGKEYNQEQILNKLIKLSETVLSDDHGFEILPEENEFWELWSKFHNLFWW